MCSLKQYFKKRKHVIYIFKNFQQKILAIHIITNRPLLKPFLSWGNPHFKYNSQKGLYLLSKEHANPIFQKGKKNFIVYNKASHPENEKRLKSDSLEPKTAT